MQEYNATVDEDIPGEEASLAEIQDLQELASYQDARVQEENEPEEEFDNVENEITAEVEPPATFPMHPPSRRSSSAFLPDTSEPVPHKRSIHTRSDFVLAIALFCEENGISRKVFTALREILRMLEPHPEISKLPESVSTLKTWAKEQLPLLPMRRKNIPLLSEKLPSLKGSAKANPATGGPPTETLYFFDPIHLFSAFLSSPEIMRKMHIGLGHFVDAPTQLWQSDSWLTSVRSTSGVYAHFTPDLSSNSSTNPIFPSDFVYHTCSILSCACHQYDTFHLSRVEAVGLDYRKATGDGFSEGSIVLRLRKALTNEETSVPLQPNELLLLEDGISYHLESAIRAIHSDIMLDYSYESRVTSQQFTIPRRNQSFIRRIMSHQGKIRPINQSHSPRAELEIAEFTRQHFVELFDRGSSVISVPLLTFIDGFGLFRNMYRTLMGVYLIIAAFSFKERARRSNVLPLTLGPHGSNFDDVVGSLQAMYDLDGGILLTINGKETLVCVFTLAYLGDMPQQNENAGFLSQRANKGCRFCFIPSTERSNLSYDIISNGRFHHENMRMRKELTSLKTKTKQIAYGRDTGLSVESPSLVTISPALDIILSRPSDPAHSEYGGVTKLAHLLLMNAILTPTGQMKYGVVLRGFPYPPGWSRLQSPQHHLNSYRLQEHARWSIIGTALLRVWLREKHIQPLYLQGLMAVHKLGTSGGTIAVNMIVSAFASIARSNALLMADSLTVSERANFITMILDARANFINLLEAAALAAVNNPRSRSTTPVRQSATSSRAGTPSAPTNAKAEAFRSDQNRPNVHIGIHYADVLKEYGLVSNCNVLIGEDKHKWFKQIIYESNFSNVERHLLGRENMQQTLRLIILGSFEQSESVLTVQIRRLHAKCPALFESLLPKSERQEDETNDEDFLHIQSDIIHSRPLGLHRLQPKYCHQVLDLPTRSPMLHQYNRLRNQLRLAYEKDYEMHSIYEFGTAPIMWCKKLSFHDRYALTCLHLSFVLN